jgi:hypothetical protein
LEGGTSRDSIAGRNEATVVPYALESIPFVAEKPAGGFEIQFAGVEVGNHTCEVYGSSLFGLLYRQGANLARGRNASSGGTRRSFVREGKGSQGGQQTQASEEIGSELE